MPTSLLNLARRSGVTRVPGLSQLLSRVKASAALRPVFERLPMRVGELTMYMPPRFWHHYLHNDYEPITSASLGEHLRPGMVVVDVGAHIGYFAMRAAQTVGESGRVIAVEPSGANVRLLRRNLARNGLRNVTVHALAASSTTGRRRFNLAGSSDSNGFYAHPLTHTERSLEVETVRLDDLVGGRVDAVKVDVEGAELEVLAGMERILAENPDLTMWVEWNPACLSQAGQAPERLPQRLEELGFDVVVLDDGAGRVRPLPEVAAAVRAGVPPSWYVNLLARRAR